MASPTPGPSRGRFQLLAQTQQEEDAFDYLKERPPKKHTGDIGSVAHLVKGALGGGILSGHFAFMKAGLYPAMVLHFIFGIYIGYCLSILVKSAQVIYKRTRVCDMSYSDVGEAAVAIFPNPKVSKWSKCFRYAIDAIICIDLFGSCATYQLIIAKTIKQLVENSPIASMEPAREGLPGLRVYLAIMIVPVIIICLITQLKWLAPFSVAANIFIVFCIGLTIYYAMQENPQFANLKTVPDSLYNIFEYLGMSVFSMSCAGIVLPVSNNMKDPSKFPGVLFIGMSVIITFVFLISFFGYVGYLDKCEVPITINFPLDLMPKILKGLIAAMIYVTHALNFFVPFHLCWYYIAPRVNQAKIFQYELMCRALFVLIIGLTAIAFPTISSFMGFLGAFCLSNMAFIWPNLIELLVIWSRPGLGPFKWRLWKCLILMGIGFILMVAGSIVNFAEMVSPNAAKSSNSPSTTTVATA